MCLRREYIDHNDPAGMNAGGPPRAAASPGRSSAVRTDRGEQQEGTKPTMEISDAQERVKVWNTKMHRALAGMSTSLQFRGVALCTMWLAHMSDCLSLQANSDQFLCLILRRSATRKSEAIPVRASGNGSIHWPGPSSRRSIYSGGRAKPRRPEAHVLDGCGGRRAGGAC